jgi:hypothetical protein
MNKELTCADRVAGEWKDRRESILVCMRASVIRCSEVAVSFSKTHEVFEEFNWLGFDYVSIDTFTDQEQGFYRLQFSYGGPQDEIRFYDNGNIQYWFLDWFDGASVDITDTKEALFIYEWFTGCYFTDCQHVGESDEIHGPFYN